MRTFLIRIGTSERGATAVEYGLIAALLVVASMAGINAFADETISMWNDVSSDVSEASENNS